MRTLHVCLTALLFVALATPCYAISQPVTKPVGSMEAFLAEYGQGSHSAAVREYFARGPLLCTGDVVLTGGGGRVDLVALGGVRVASGAVVRWDDPALIITGPPPCIRVERGGTLRIQRWHPMMTNGVIPTAGMIRVEAGGVLQVAAGVMLPAGMVIVEEDTPPNTLLPPEPAPAPEPERIPVEGLYKPIQYLSCGTGHTTVAAALPATVETYLAGGLMREFGVRWDLSELDCDTPGTYLVYGDFIPESLAGKGASNPKGLRPAASLTLLPSTPIQDLSWRAIGPSGASVPTLLLAFAALPADVEHLYLSRSVDGVNWRRCVRYETSSNAVGEDFLSAIHTNRATSFLVYQMPQEFGVLYLRLEVDGSVRAGSSNPIRVQSSDFGGALGSGGPNSDAEDGSSGGNRGGGQGAFDREGQKDAAQTPAQPGAAADTALPQGAKPEQEMRHQTEAEAAQAEQEIRLSGSTYSGGGSGNYGLRRKLEQTIFSEERAIKEDVPEAQQRTDEGAHLNQAAEESEPPTASEVSEAQVQALAVESRQTASTGDGDTSALVAAATLAVCLFSAAGIYFIQNRSHKRKS